MKLIRLSNVNFVMTFLVVGIHTIPRVYPNQTDMTNTLFVYRYVNNLTAIAVPTFFAISSYLFFYKFAIGDYFIKLKKRCRSLLIPYLIFSILGLLLVLVKSLLKHSIMDEKNIADYLFSIITSKYNAPLWYLVTLFEFVVIAPLVFWIITFRKAFVNTVLLSLIFIIINLFFTISYTNIIFWLPIIIPFSYMGIYKKKLFLCHQKTRWWKYMALFAILLVPIFLLLINASDYDVSYYIWRITSPFIILLFVAEFLDYDTCFTNQGAFFVYLSHSLILRLLEHFQPSMLYIAITKWIIVFCFCLVISRMLSKLSPFTYKVISGGR